MSPSGDPTKSSSTGAWSALEAVAAGLKDHPVLLFGFGLALVLLAAGALALEKLRLIAIILLVICVLTLAAWLVTLATGRNRAAIRVRAGGARAGFGVRMTNSSITGGNVSGSGIHAGDADVNAGSAGAGPFAELNDSHITGGKVD